MLYKTNNKTTGHNAEQDNVYDVASSVLYTPSKVKLD